MGRSIANGYSKREPERGNSFLKETANWQCFSATSLQYFATPPPDDFPLVVRIRQAE
jgi:hypothetical protein